MENETQFIPQAEFLGYMQSLHNDQLTNLSFLENLIQYKAGLRMGRRFRREHKIVAQNCWQNLCCKQYPNELAKFLLFIYKHKEHINRYLEIGIERAGTFIVIDSYLRAINPNYKGGVGIDRRPRISHLSEYFAQAKTCEIKATRARKYKPDERFDLCFVDATHVYPGVQQEFNDARTYSKITALHDIVLEPGVKQLWAEIKDSNKPEDYTEITNDKNEFPGSLGIGILHPGFN